MKYNPKSQKLRELLKMQELMKRGHSLLEPEFDDDYSESNSERPKWFINSHALFQEAAAKITAEQDIKIVREIALDYIDSICSTLPDNVATEISRQMNGL